MVHVCFIAQFILATTLGMLALACMALDLRMMNLEHVISQCLDLHAKYG